MTAAPRGSDGAEHRRLRRAAVMRWSAVTAIAAVAALRCTALQVAHLHFDVDPTLDPAPLPAISAGVSLLLDALLFAACAAGLLGEHLARRGVDWRLLLAALLPLPVVLAHGWTDAGDLWRGSTWAAAALAAATVAHLARERAMRAALLAVLLAVLAPLAVRGALQVTIEHAATVEQFEQHRERFLAERGWAPGSPNALIYERRLRQPQPLGWFPTTNVYASVLVFALTLSAGLAWSALRERRRGLALLLASAMAIALVLLWLTGAKGAVVAAWVGLGLLAAMLLAPRRLAPRAGPVAAVLLALALLGVVVRGAVLPEGFLGERSLLFRWHYMVGAAHVIAEEPLAGSGPDGFQDRYVLHRPPRSPEEPVSAHSIFVDWIATLGVSAAAWIGLVLLILLRAAPRNDEPAPEQHSRRAALRAVAAAGAIAMIGAIWAEVLVLDPMSLVLRLLGWAGFLALGLGAAAALHGSDHRRAGAALLAAAAALLVHAQVEMTFFQSGAAVWAMAVVGVLGGLGAVRPRGPRWIAPAAAIAALLAAGWIAVTGALPAARAQRLAAEAAAALHPPAPGAAARIEQRQRAIALLEQAHGVHGADVSLLVAAADQAMLAAAETKGTQRLELLERARALASDAVAAGGGLAAAARRASASRQIAGQTGSADDWQRAIDDARVITRLDPRAWTSWRRLGEVLEAAGRADEAAHAFEQARRNSAAFELDPLKQWGERVEALSR